MLGTILILSALSMPAVAPDGVPTAMPVYAGVSVADSDNRVPDAPSEKLGAIKLPFVSVKTDVLDMSWTGAMDQADPDVLRPTGIMLPFLESYPLDNFEVKLHLLNLRF